MLEPRGDCGHCWGLWSLTTALGEDLQDPSRAGKGKGLGAVGARCGVCGKKGSFRIFNGPTEDLAVLGGAGPVRTSAAHEPDEASWKPAPPICTSIKTLKSTMQNRSRLKLKELKTTFFVPSSLLSEVKLPLPALPAPHAGWFCGQHWAEPLAPFIWGQNSSSVAQHGGSEARLPVRIPALPLPIWNLLTVLFQGDYQHVNKALRTTASTVRVQSLGSAYSSAVAPWCGR